MACHPREAKEATTLAGWLSVTRRAILGTPGGDKLMFNVIALYEYCKAKNQCSCSSPSDSRSGQSVRLDRIKSLITDLIIHPSHEETSLRRKHAVRMLVTDIAKHQVTTELSCQLATQGSPHVRAQRVQTPFHLHIFTSLLQQPKHHLPSQITPIQQMHLVPSPTTRPRWPKSTIQTASRNCTTHPTRPKSCS